MSDHLEGNPYVTEGLEGAKELAEHATAQATLALAYEQRRTAEALETGNLIAYYALWNRIEGSYPNGSMDIDLQKRLGLNDE